MTCRIDSKLSYSCVQFVAMKRLDKNTAEISAGLKNLAKFWLELVEKLCPDDWLVLWPEMNLARIDQQLSPRQLPVLSYLEQMSKQAPPDNRRIVECLIQLQHELHFNQTYTARDFGAAFLRQYGWIKFLGPDAYWQSDVLSSGLVLLGDYITYPEHWHEAEEIYFPISGTAEWYHQGHGWQAISTGTMIHHASNVRHAMRTIGEPLLALYVWRGGNLTQKSTIRDS